MTFLKLHILVAFSFLSPSLQDSPVLDFCRRWGHQTAIVDQKLYIDGGSVAYKNLAANYTNDYLLFSDLKSRTDVGFPEQHANLTKPASIPSLSGAYLWADEVNKCFYQFGGAFPEAASPKDFGMWTYDVIMNQWNETKYISSDKNWQRPAYGAGAQVDSRGLGFYYGGWLSNRTTPDWKGPPMALSSIVQFNFTTGNLRNNTHPDGIGRAEGQMVFLPVSDGGLLVYFGGVEDTYRNGSYNAANMTKIHIYDINSAKWYSQTASGDVPLARRQFCAGVTWPDDRSSFNIYVYGGYGFGNPPAFDDVYILSLPSFTWIKGYPLGGSDTNQFGHGGCTANVMNPDQMMVIGGWFSNSTFGDCDSPDSQGQHNMILGNNTGKKENGLWDKYDPKLSTYAVPTLVIAAIGGGPTGGATVTAPATWDNNDVRAYYKISASFATRAATRALPATASPTSSSSGKKNNIGAIAGGTVGGVVVLIAILCLILFCLHRRKKAKKSAVQERPAAPPQELAVTPYPHEMSTTDASKYVAVHEQPNPNELPAYSGHGVVQPTSTAYGHPSQSPLRSPNGAESYFQSEYVGYGGQQGSYHQQSGSPQQTSPRQQSYPYPTPTTPQHTIPSPAQDSQTYYPPPTTQQHTIPSPAQESQTYYPPPTTQQHTTPSPAQESHIYYPREYVDSRADDHYIGDGYYGDASRSSTTHTPAHFYNHIQMRLSQDEIRSSDPVSR